jgi:hypothetical protein
MPTCPAPAPVGAGTPRPARPGPAPHTALVRWYHLGSDTVRHVPDVSYLVRADSPVSATVAAGLSALGHRDQVSWVLSGLPPVGPRPGLPGPPLVTHTPDHDAGPCPPACTDPDRTPTTALLGAELAVLRTLAGPCVQGTWLLAGVDLAGPGAAATAARDLLGSSATLQAWTRHLHDPAAADPAGPGTAPTYTRYGSPAHHGAVVLPVAS